MKFPMICSKVELITTYNMLNYVQFNFGFNISLHVLHLMLVDGSFNRIE